MKKQVCSFSGGRTSAYLCKILLEKFGKDNVEFVFMDTGAEHPKTYSFIKKCNQHFNLDLKCLRAKFDDKLGVGTTYALVDVKDINCDFIPFNQMMRKYGVPYIGGMFCTDRMKTTPFKKYCQDVFGADNYETWLGIRVDEQRRLKSKEGIKYLADISDFDKQDVLDFWKGMPFDLEIPEWLGNCVFCPKKSNLKLAAAQRDEPEIYHKWLDCLYDDNVRYDSKTGHYSKMYRGRQSLESLIMSFDGLTGESIKKRLRVTKTLDTNSCSESCEVFNLD